jgi:hypothetical protein
MVLERIVIASLLYRANNNIATSEWSMNKCGFDYDISFYVEVSFF